MSHRAMAPSLVAIHTGSETGQAIIQILNCLTNDKGEIAKITGGFCPKWSNGIHPQVKVGQPC